MSHSRSGFSCSEREHRKWPVSQTAAAAATPPTERAADPGSIYVVVVLVVVGREEATKKAEKMFALKIIASLCSVDSRRGDKDIAANDDAAW